MGRVVVLILIVGLWLEFTLHTVFVAHASGNAVARFGGEHGTVNDTNPTALYYNPGAIGFSKGLQLFIDGQLALRNLTWRHAPGQGDVDPPGAYRGANYGVAKASNLFGGPMLGATLQLSNFVLGAAAYAPFGGNVSFQENPHYASREYPGARDGVARWHGIDAGTMSIYTTLGVAYRMGPVSFGVTGNLILTSMHLTRAQTLDGTNDLKQEGRSQIDVSGVHGSFGLGVMIAVLPERLYLSASYQAQPGLGVQKLDGTLRVDSTVHQSDDSFTRDVTFHQALPDIWRLGLRFRPTHSVELRLAADLTRWSVLQTQCVALRNAPCVVTPEGDGLPDSEVVQNVRRYWRNTIGVRVGASMWITPTLELFTGLGYEMGASPDRTLEPVLADSDNMAVAIGGRIELAASWYLAAGYTHLQFLPRDNTGKSQLANPFTAALTRRPDAGGQYEQWVAILNVNITKTF